MAIDIDEVIELLDEARRGLNDARNAADDWRRGKVSGVNYTAEQKTALRASFDAGIQVGKNGIAAVETELAK